MTQSAEVAPNGRILVVDDDASLAEMLTIVLRQEGFDSRMVARGDEAMDAFHDYKPDLVLLDLMLPGKDGIDVCKEMRAESGVPIVMLTAKGDTIDVVLGLESGADDYVVKPFKPKELVARIRARVRRFDSPPSGARSKAVYRFPSVSPTSRVPPSAVTTMPLGKSRSSATTVTVPSGSTRFRLPSRCAMPNIQHVA